ncbi:MAG: hypothetical protein CMO55_05775 [Verrucomicrobiales bacterium]|nr:hypothetical protein [Verrucomicrobiales bacterium]
MSFQRLTPFPIQLLPLLALCATMALAQDLPTPGNVDSDTPTTTGSSVSADGMVTVQFPNTPIPIILLAYEEWTGKTVIRDTSIQDKSMIVQTSKEMTKEEAARFIEESFLLNGYAFVPTEKPEQLKLIAFNADKRLSSEGLPVITNEFQLPDSEQVVTYIMPLAYLSSEAAAELFTNIVELHPYGKIVPLENASALVITENAPVIRRLIELRNNLDVSPIKTETESFQLERADSEKVVEALIDILGLDQQTTTTSTQAQPGQQPRQQNPNPEAAQSPDNLIPSQNRASANYAKANSPQPRVRAITRANRVLVVATPTDMQYITDIITHLDAPVERVNYMRRKLRFIAVNDFLQIAGNVIQRVHNGEEGDSQTQIAGGQQNQQNQQNNNTFGNNNNNNNNNLGGSSFGSGGATGNLGNAGSDQAAAPSSVVIGKTLLVADNVQNMLIASGPPEHLMLIEEILDEMDIRPQQIQISALIAQLNLGDDFEFGFDLLRTLESPGTSPDFNGGGSFLSRAGQSQALADLSTLTDPANLISAAAQGFTFYGQINPHLDTFISALNSTNRFKVLSRPTVYTVNNRQAVIETGQRVAVPSSTLSSIDVDNNNPNQVVTANIDYINVVLSVSVIPLINSEGEITLQIQQRNDDIVGQQLIGNNSVPTIGTQTLGTTIIVDDGGTVLLGGLISEGDSKAESGIPLFASLPLVGRVFGSTLDNVNRQELLIFIQPKIINDKCEHEFVDDDMITRTRVGQSAEEFAVNADNNVELFDSQDFNSPEKRINFFKNLFKKKETPKAMPAVRAVPIEPAPDGY